MTSLISELNQYNRVGKCLVSDPENLVKIEHKVEEVSVHVYKFYIAEGSNLYPVRDLCHHKKGKLKLYNPNVIKIDQIDEAIRLKQIFRPSSLKNLEWDETIVITKVDNDYYAAPKAMSRV